MQCKCGNHYHPNHGCGMAVGCGTSFADHIMFHDGEHEVEKREFKNNSEGLKEVIYYKKISPSAEERAEKGNFRPWECPANAGMCPWCWHKKYDTIKN